MGNPFKIFKLIRGAEVVAPERLGKKDVLICCETIAEIGENFDIGTLARSCEVIEADGLTLLPGYIDAHVHIIGGGGEAGCATRTPEVTLSDVTRCGITTVIGVLAVCRLHHRHPSIFPSFSSLCEGFFFLPSFCSVP